MNAFDISRKVRSSLLCLALSVAGAACVAPSPEPAAPQPAAGEVGTAVRSGYADVNGLHMYYEVHGSGKPLVVLHGGMCTIGGCLGGVIPVLAPGRQVIALEQQAHGRTADIDRPLNFVQMAEDSVAALRTLKVEKADFFGYSDGGNVALGIAIAHPELVDRLVVLGTNYNNDGLVPGLVDAFGSMKAEDMPKEIREEYEKVAPDPQQFPRLVAKVMQQAVAFPGWSRAQLQAIQAPALVMIGDRDIIRPEHALEMFRLMPRGQLAVIAGSDHIVPILDPAVVGSSIDRFLRGPAPAHTDAPRW